MALRTRLALAGLVVLAVVAAAQLPLAGWLWPPPPLVESPALVAEGRRVAEGQCLHCHDQIALPERVRGWDVRRAYDAVGRLPELNGAMPGFHGTDAERRALAAWLADQGRR